MNFKTFNAKLAELINEESSNDSEYIDNTIKIYKFICCNFAKMKENLDPDEVFSCKEFIDLFIKNIDENTKKYTYLQRNYSNASEAILWMDVAKRILEFSNYEEAEEAEDDNDGMPGPYDHLSNVEKSGLILSTDTYEGIDCYDN
jgi:hypothetical protein